MVITRQSIVHSSVVLTCLARPFIWLRQPGTGDTQIFLEWMSTMLQYGPIQGYVELHRDYPPLTPLVLYLLGIVADLIGLSHFLAFKLSIILGNALVWWIVWRWSRRFWFSLLVYLSLILNTAIMGYSDVYIAIVLLVGLWCVQQKRWAVATVLLTLMMFLKWTPLVLGPLLLIYVGYSTYQHGGLRSLVVHAALPAAITSGLTVFIFGYSSIHSAWIYASLQTFLSGDALNMNWLLTYWLHLRNPAAFGGLEHGITYIQLTDVNLLQMVRWLFYSVYFSTLAVFVFKKKTFEQFLVMSLVAFLAYFLFNLGVHENHLFLAMMLSYVLVIVHWRYWPLALGWAIAFNLNELSFFREFSSWRVVYGFDLTFILAVLNVLGWLGTWRYFALSDFDWYWPVRMFRRILKTSRKL